MTRRYNNDQSELVVKWQYNCSTCGVKLPKDVNAYYLPNSKKMYCLSCGDEDFRQFHSTVADEDKYNKNAILLTATHNATPLKN